MKTLTMDNIKVGEVYGMDFQDPQVYRWNTYTKYPVLVIKLLPKTGKAVVITDNKMLFKPRAQDLTIWNKPIPDDMVTSLDGYFQTSPSTLRTMIIKHNGKKFEFIWRDN